MAFSSFAVGGNQRGNFQIGTPHVGHMKGKGGQMNFNNSVLGKLVGVDGPTNYSGGPPLMELMANQRLHTLTPNMAASGGFGGTGAFIKVLGPHENLAQLHTAH